MQLPVLTSRLLVYTIYADKGKCFGYGSYASSSDSDFKNLPNFVDDSASKANGYGGGYITGIKELKANNGDWDYGTFW